MTAVASYTYDSFGNILTATDDLVDVNPLRYHGYVYDGETGFYYVSSRYYDPEIERFINADAIELIGANGDFTSINLFAYCGSNPISRRDTSGHAWETIFDVLSLGASILEVAFNPADPFAWLGLAGDTVDLIPFVTGVGETIRALKTTSKVAETVEGAGDAIDTYRDLKKVTKGTGLEVHHIVEKRLGNALGYENTNDMLSIALSKADHKQYTKKWRGLLPYGSSYKDKRILETAIKIYSDNPKLLGAAIYTIAK